MKSENNLRTKGYGYLPYEQQERIRQMLRAKKTAFRLAGRGADEEITLLKISVTGVIPAVIKAILGAFDIELAF